MKLAKFLLTPPIAAISVFLSATLGAQARDVTFTTADDVATLQSVIDGLSSGDRVLLGDGIYRPGYTIYLTNGVTLAGSHYTNCVIRPTGSRRTIWMDGAQSVLTNLTISGGTTSGFDHGSGIRMYDGVISHCMISNNATSGGNARGAGIDILGGTLRYSVITKNRGGSYGAGVYIGDYGYKILPKPVLVDRCLVYGNSSTGGGGAGVATYSGNDRGSKFIVRHCTIANNTSPSCAGLYIWTIGTCEAIESCIIADNIQTVDSGAAGKPNWAINGATSTPKFKNCLFGNGSGTVGSDPVPGNASFKSLAADNYHLTGASDALDQGLVPTTSLIDLDGNPVVDGKPDIGCYEYDAASEPFDVVMTYSVDSILEGAKVTYSGTPVNPPKEKTLAYLWTLTDGSHTQTSTALSGAFTIEEAGQYSLSLCVKDADMGEVLLDKLGEKEIPVYVRDVWATPSDNLTSVVSALKAGQVLHLAEGTYPLSAAVALTAGATIIGAGRDKTIIDGQNAYRPFSLDERSAVVSNLTIRAINAPNDNGTCVTISRGKLLDVRVTACRINNAKYGKTPLLIKNGGLVDHCTIDSCTNVNSSSFSTWTYTRASGVVVENGKLRNSLICRNYGNAPDGTVFLGANSGGSGLMENCTVVDNLNEGSTCEAVAVLIGDGGSVRNTIVTRNSSPNWTSAYTDSKAPTASAPDWAYRAQGVTQANSYNNCWGDSEEDFGKDCADGSKILFKDPTSGNYRISVLSSCYDAGKLDVTWMTGATDLDGNPRVFHKNRVDIGCYECQDTRGLVIQVR